ncbi:hypothetical protein D3C72_1444760 [compost metagenome]
MIAVALGGHAQRHGVGAGVGLGQGERPDQLAARQLGQIARTLLVGPGQHDGLRADADVGAGQRTERGRGLAQFEHHAHFLFHRQAQAAEVGRDRQAEQAQLAHFVDDVRRHLAARGQFVFGGNQAFVHKAVHGVQQQVQGFGVEGHDGSLSR